VFFLIIYLAGAEFSRKFVYAALFAIGGMSGFTALGFSFIARDTNSDQRWPVAWRLGRYRAPPHVAFAFLAIAYLCIVAVVISTGFFNQ
jgi:hypothetical protein